MLSNSSVINDNDNDKRLGLTAKADQPDHKKMQYTKNKNVYVHKLLNFVNKPSGPVHYRRLRRIQMT